MTLAMARSRGMLPLCCLGLGLWSFLAWDADFLVPRPAFPGAAEAGLSRASGAPRRAFPLEKLLGLPSSGIRWLGLLWGRSICNCF